MSENKNAPADARNSRTYNIVLQHDEKEDTLEKVAKILSYVAIPVVIAVGGWLYSESQQKREIDQKHLQLAIDILSTQEKFERGNLRTWAVSVLETTSPDGVNIPKEMAQSLRDGIAFLPTQPRLGQTGTLEPPFLGNEYVVGFSATPENRDKLIAAINTYSRLTTDFNEEQNVVGLDRATQQQFKAVSYQLELFRNQIAVKRFGREAVDDYLRFKRDDGELPASLTEQQKQKLTSFFEARLQY